MTKRPAFRGIAAILLALAASWVAVSCASAPPKAPETPPAAVAEPAPVTPPAEKPAPEPVTKAPALTEEAYAAVQAAIDEAVAAGAEAFAADLLNQARQSLALAREKAETDPEGAKTLLQTAADQARAARDAALARFAQDAQKAVDGAVAAGAEQYSPDLLDQARKALAQGQDSQKTGPAAQTRGFFQTAIDKANAARDAAAAGAQAAKLRTLLDQLDQEVQAAIDEAVAAGAEQYSPDLLGQARTAQTQARDKASSAPREAEPLYRDALAKAHAARDAALAAQAKSLLDRLDQEATQAIAQAEAAEADQYAPGPLNLARKALLQARDQSGDAPDKAQASYRTAIDQARAARDAAQTARTQALLAKLDAASAAWKALQPEKWTPDEAAALEAQTAAAREAVAADYGAGLPLATEALGALGQATTRWKTRLAAVQELRLKAQKALADAEAADAFVWVPDLIQTANDAFFQGTGAWRKFRIDAAEEAWNTALYQAQSAQAKAQGVLDRKRTEKLMLDTMKKIEDASGKTVVDPNDNIIAPNPWDGKKELEKIQAKPLSLLIPADGSPAVLGEKQRVTYLDEAKDQWVQGVKALEAGDLTLANEAFFQAQKLIDTYLSLAVDKIYTVKLNPDKRDSLWRIAGNGEIYDTPWEWPKIWKRNQKLIQNPDLIYPGWQLIIPPQ